MNSDVKDDPIEPVNRVIFSMNESLDETVFSPFYCFYENLPQSARQGFFSFVQNIGTPVSLLNALWNGEYEVAVRHFYRFMVNTIFGFCGIFDVARDVFDVEHEPRDFGKTFQKMGIPSGPFIVLPILGPSTLRDLFGSFIDVQINPGRIFSLSSKTYAALNFLSLKLSYQKSQKEFTAIFEDRYAFTRDSYLQLRGDQVHEEDDQDTKEETQKMESATQKTAQKAKDKKKKK